MSALTIYQKDGFDTIQRTAMALYKSGYFTDAKSEAQAIVKVMAGAELGLPPFASMTGIHVIQGKPALGANLIASLIKSHPNYNYRVIELTPEVCRIQFYENGEKSGVSEFTAQDAQRAGVKNMQKYPKNMLFARAISNGARWHCPDIFGGSPVYTGEELGVDFDEDGYIESSYTEAPQEILKAVDVAELGYMEGGAPDCDPLGEWYCNAPADKRAFASLIERKVPRYTGKRSAAFNAIKNVLANMGADFDQLTQGERDLLAQRVATYAEMRDSGAESPIAMSAATS